MVDALTAGPAGTRNVLTRVAAGLGVALGGAALAVSLTHAGPVGPAGVAGRNGAVGPAGPPGPAGATGQAAQTARLGVCWNAPLFTQNWADGTSDTWVSSVSLDAPQLTNGVYTCPQGEQFVSVVPQDAPSNG